MKPDEKKSLNYWQNPDEEEIQQLAPEQDPDLPSAVVSEDPELTEDDPVNWDGQEYIHLERNGLWFVLFAVAVLGLIALSIFFMKSWTFTAVIIAFAVAIIVYIRRAPRTIHYTLSEHQGLYIGERLYPYSDFKAFGMIRDGEHFSIMLIPTKRFSPGVSVYFPEAAGEQIIDILGARLPMENLKLDIIDIIVRKLRL